METLQEEDSVNDAAIDTILEPVIIPMEADCNNCDMESVMMM